MNDNSIPKISTKTLNFSFGEKHVLKDITVGFPAKKITALIGPSGCGKSTLLRCFNRMHDLLPYAHISGQIFLDKKDIYNNSISVTQVRKKIGMVFQKANPFPKTIYENIAYGLRINNFEKSKIKHIVEHALQESYLWEEVKDELKKPATQLSGGQQQRLCIARAIALRPEVILMDEPCSALDPISTGKIEELILELKKDYTIIIVTHNMQQAQRVADETAFMYMGETIEKGVTEKMFKHPEKELTKNYVNGHFG
jgi:phosphate transport system ATP-binding protein